MTKEEYFEQFKQQVQNNDIVVYMKGSQKMPMCGFSAAACAVFNNLNVPFQDYNILADENVRTYLKEFSNWPTFPQIYVKGEFIGGCDILREMFQTGELQDLLKEKGLIAA